MDSVSDLLQRLASLNIKLGLDENDNLLIRGKKDNLNHDLISSIKTLKPEIVLLLKANHQLPINLAARELDSDKSVVSF